MASTFPCSSAIVASSGRGMVLWSLLGESARANLRAIAAGMDHSVSPARRGGVKEDHSARVTVRVSMTGGPSVRNAPFHIQRLPVSTLDGAIAQRALDGPPPAT